MGMTTNHPEKLDPALIRPGRINQHLHLGYMNSTDMGSLAEHYMGYKLSEEQQEQLKPFRNVTPARVEQACAEAADFESFVTSLRSPPQIESIGESPKKKRKSPPRTSSTVDSSQSDSCVATAEPEGAGVWSDVADE